MPGAIKSSMSYPLPTGFLKKFANQGGFDNDDKRKMITTGLGKDIEKVICEWVINELANGEYINDDRIQWKAR